MARAGRLTIVVLVAALAFACSTPPPESGTAHSKPTVYVVNYPLEYFAQRIGGDLIDVRFPAPASVDPAFWMPGEATVLAYQQADLILLNGADYAHWVGRVSLPDSRMVDTSAAFKDRFIQIQGAVTHSHGPEGPHTHAGTAFTTWLDPAQAAQQVRATAAALERLLPDHAKTIEQNRAALAADLEGLDAALKEFAADSGVPLLASHPVYQYLARAYGWDLESVHWEPGEMPEPGEWDQLARSLEHRRARWMIWEAPPVPDVAAGLQKLGVTPVAFYTCATEPESGDYLSVMRENIERLRPVFARR